VLEEVRPAKCIVVQEHDEVAATRGDATIRSGHIAGIVGVRNQHNLGEECADALGCAIRRTAVRDDDSVWDGLRTEMAEAPLSELPAVVRRDDDVDGMAHGENVLAVRGSPMHRMGPCGEMTSVVDGYNKIDGLAHRQHASEQKRPSA
jgi:hypothetical protein